MSRRRNPVPTYRLHAPSGQAVITLRLPDGGRKDVYLGEYDSPESRQEYTRILQEIAVSPGPKSAASPIVGQTDLTMNELLEAFMEHARCHYRHPCGSTTARVNASKLSLTSSITRLSTARTPPASTSDRHSLPSARSSVALLAPLRRSRRATR